VGLFQRQAFRVTRLHGDVQTNEDIKKVLGSGEWRTQQCHGK